MTLPWIGEVTSAWVVALILGAAFAGVFLVGLGETKLSGQMDELKRARLELAVAPAAGAWLALIAGTQAKSSFESGDAVWGAVFVMSSVLAVLGAGARMLRAFRTIRGRPSVQ